MGPVHPWQFVEEAASKEVEKDFKSVFSRLVLCKTFRLNEDGKVLSPEELLFRCVEAVNFTHNPKRTNDENINNSNISKYKEKHTNKRRQSDVSSSPQQNPIRGEACYFDRFRHRSDNDTKSRRFVLNASSKVPIEVRRNHSGSNSLSLY